MFSPTAAAASAYANLARVIGAGGSGSLAANLGGLPNGGTGTGTGNETGGPSFGAVLKDAISSVADAGHKSDAQTVAMASGKANVMDVVTAVAETDVAVSTLVSVRDRVIQSYEDIMKMPI
jgi:flagellar hook-basal body complex protein FliE